MTQPTPERVRDAMATFRLFAKAINESLGIKPDPPARPLRPRVVDMRGRPRRRADQ